MKKFFWNNFAGKIITGLVLTAAVGTILLVLIVKSQPIPYWDIALAQKLQSSETGKLTTVMRWISFFGDYPAAAFVLAFAAAFFALLGCLRETLFIFLIPIADLFNFLIKIMVNRPRPPAELVSIYQKFTDPGFPSGHVVHYVVFFGFIFAAMMSIQKLSAIIRMAIATLSAALIIFISVSRIYLGVHWPTDIIAGYFIGFSLLSFLLFFYFRQPTNNRSNLNNK